MLLALRMMVISWTLMAGVIIIICIGICIGIICGNRVAYSVARFLYGMTAILMFFNAFNPMVYHEAIFTEMGDGSLVWVFVWIFLKLALISLISILLCWCLGEHSKLRRKDSDKNGSIKLT
jgi:hypothetical protein